MKFNEISELKSRVCNQYSKCDVKNISIYSQSNYLIYEYDRTVEKIETVDKMNENEA